MSLKDRLLVDAGPEYDSVRFSPQNQLLQRISTNSKNVERLVKKVGGQQDTFQIRDELKENSQALIKDINEVKVQIQNLGQSSDAGDRVQYNKLSRDFKSVVSKAEIALKRYDEMESRYPTQHLYERELSMRRTASLNREGQQELQAQEQAELGLDDAVAIEQRNQELARLHEDIVGLNELGRQLAIGVGEQQEQIDVIEDKVEGAGEDVRGGGRALQLGSLLASKNRKLMVIIALVIVGVVVGVVVLVIIIAVAAGCSVPGRCGT